MPILWGDQYTTERRARLRRLQSTRWESIRAALWLGWSLLMLTALTAWLLWESAHPFIER